MLGKTFTNLVFSNKISFFFLKIFFSNKIVRGMRYQGRRQTSEQDESIFERRRSEPLGGSGGMFPPPPQGNFEICSCKHFPWYFSSEKVNLGQV